jgi:hypothetical protein
MRSDLQERVNNAAPDPTFGLEQVRHRAARERLRRRLSAAVVAFVIAGGGIGGLFLSFGPGEPKPKPPATQIDGVIHRAYLPITDARDWTVDEQRTMHEAQFLLVSRCMRRAGFENPDIPFAPYTLDRRYGLQDLDAARKWGYGLPPTMVVDESAVQAYTDSLSPKERRTYESAYGGGPDGAEAAGTDNSTMPGGCADEARDALYGSTTQALRAEELRGMSYDIEFEAYFASEKDPRVQLAVGAWSDCMEERGYHVSDLADPLDASLLAGGPVGGPEDVRLAVTVVRCNDATDLVEIWSGVEAAIQGQLLEKHRASMREFFQLREQAYENALQIANR